MGPISFLIAYFLPILSQNPKAHRLLAIFILVVIWWVTECIPIPATALLVPILITVFRIASVKEAFAPFSNPIIMLFLGSFILARAMSVHSLDRKLAFSILSLKSIARKKTRILFAMGLTTAFLSLWISNTATTAMMYPIVLGILAALPAQDKGRNHSSFGLIILLTIAYSASIGGIGTPIGSPPNLIAIGMLENLTNNRITFFQWMTIGFLILVPMYLALFLFMKFRLKREKVEPEGRMASIQDSTKAQKGLTRAQKNVLVAFLVAVSLWTIPGIVSLIWGKESAIYLWLHSHFPEQSEVIHNRIS